MRFARVMEAAEALAPPQLAESWDNVGLLVGDPAQDVTRVLLTIDYTPAVAQELRDQGCQAVMAYHPPIFAGLKKITAGTPVFDALRHGVALYSFHTALDVVNGGTNDMLADAAGLLARAPLRPHPTDAGIGMGRIGETTPGTLGQLVTLLKEQLGLRHVLVAGSDEHPVHRVAVCAGACGEYLDDALRAGAHVFVTGELRHHDALKALSRGMAVVAALHSNSERRVLLRVRDQMARACPDVTFLVSEADRDPFDVR